MRFRGRSPRAAALVVVLLAAVAVTLAVALERPGAPRPLGPPVIVDQRAKPDSSPSSRTRLPQERRARSRGERRRHSPARRAGGSDAREHVPGAGEDERERTTAPPTASSGASPVRSPTAPAAGRDDDGEDDDDDADEAEGNDDADGDNEPDGADE
jgi:hypothetical protein